MTDARDTIVSRSRLIERSGVTRAALMGGVVLAAMAVCGVRAPVRAGNTAIVISSTPSGSTYTNSGIIHGTLNGVLINATVNTLTNSAMLSSPEALAKSFGYNGAFNSIRKTLGGATGFQNITGVATLTNAGTISVASTWAVGNHYYSSGFTTISNSGPFVGAASGLLNTSPTGFINNESSGTIYGGKYGVFNDAYGSIGTITNSGKILGDQAGIYSEISLGNVTNNAGATISGGQGAYGIYNGGTMGTLPLLGWGIGAGLVWVMAEIAGALRGSL